MNSSLFDSELLKVVHVLHWIPKHWLLWFSWLLWNHFFTSQIIDGFVLIRLDLELHKMKHLICSRHYYSVFIHWVQSIQIMTNLSANECYFQSNNWSENTLYSQGGINNVIIWMFWFNALNFLSLRYPAFVEIPIAYWKLS